MDNEQVRVPRRKLIEVGIPLEAINAASAREKSIRHGHPSTLHLWWSRKPLATARAVLFSQLVDDPSSHPDLFPTLEEQDAERQRLHRLIERMVVWENSNDTTLFAQARKEIRSSNGGELPEILDPFAGGGTIPLEAQRLGLEAHASDLNPVAVLINKALIEIPPRFANRPPAHPGAGEMASDALYRGAQGMAEDVRRYGKWMRDQAWERIGHLYPKVVDDNGVERTVIAWKWARTVRSPNPANPIYSPLVNSWWLSKKKGKEAYVVPHVDGSRVTYEVRHDALGPRGENEGTVNRKGARVVGDGTPIDFKYIRAQGQIAALSEDLIAVVAEGDRGREYINASQEQLEVAKGAAPVDPPEADLPPVAPSFRVQAYGFKKWSDLFTARQLVALTTFSDLVGEAREHVLQDALAQGMPAGERLEAGGTGAEAYADAVATYLGLVVSRTADRLSSLSSWDSSNPKIRNTFSRQAIPMVWDFAEANPFSSSTGSLESQLRYVIEAIEVLPCGNRGTSSGNDASLRDYTRVAISTDPPYYDNIGYSDLSDYFYVWQRRALKTVYPDLFATLLTPKAGELVANPYRHGGKEGAQEFFVDGFNQVFARMRAQARSDIPITVYYAYKQQDTNGDNGESSSGWETLLSGLISAGWEITATWPVRSELSNRMLSNGTNALASSIVLACRPRPDEAPATTRQRFTGILKRDLPPALRAMMQGAVAPVDLAQAAIGPGMAVFSRYSRVRDADGSDMSVRNALELINQTIDEVLGDEEAGMDADTRFAVKWYRTYGWGEENSGIADQLSRSMATSPAALAAGGIFRMQGGKARVLAPAELQGEWSPLEDDRVSTWEATVRLAAILDSKGAVAVQELLPAVTRRVPLDSVKTLGFLLFRRAEMNGDTKDANLFNGLVSMWNDLTASAAKSVGEVEHQDDLDLGME